MIVDDACVYAARRGWWGEVRCGGAATRLRQCPGLHWVRGAQSIPKHGPAHSPPHQTQKSIHRCVSVQTNAPVIIFTFQCFTFGSPFLSVLVPVSFRGKIIKCELEIVENSVSQGLFGDSVAIATTLQYTKGECQWVCEWCDNWFSRQLTGLLTPPPRHSTHIRALRLSHPSSSRLNIYYNSNSYLSRNWEVWSFKVVSIWLEIAALSRTTLIFLPADGYSDNTDSIWFRFLLQYRIYEE